MKNKILQKFDGYYEDFKGFNFVSRIIVWFMDKAVLEAIQKINPKTILEIGCGSGRSGKKIREHVSKYTGIDNSPRSIELCRKSGLNVLLEKADKTNFESDAFNMVYSEGLLEHYKDFIPFAKEMVRLSDKHILLLQPNYHSLAGKLLNWGTRIIGHDPLELPYKKEEYIKAFESFGCKLLYAEPVCLGAFNLFLFLKNGL